MAVLSTLQSTVEKPSHMEESDSESSHEDGDVDFEVKGGFQLLDLIITELKSQMTCYKIKVSHWWKFYLSKKSFTGFALQSECCNFNQL